MRRNHVVTQCSSCKAKCWKWIPMNNPAYWVSFTIYMIVASNVLPFNRPVVAIALLIPFIIAWNTMENRLYHNYFMWRHPVRCGGRGHHVPETP